MPSPTQQLLSRTIYATDGTTTDWNFSFSGGYLDQAHVQAYTESSTGIRTDLTINVSQLIGPYQLRISPALAIGDTLVIYRATPRDLPMVDFTDGSGLSETALDVSAKQAVFLAAEIADETGLAGVSAASGYAQAAEEQAILAEASANSASASALSAEASATLAGAALDSFDDRYLGSKASNPTLDNDGNALLVGAMYWNTALSELRFWSGSVWNTINLSGTSYALNGANSDITSLAALQSVNGGQLAGIRNKVVNSNFGINQKAVSGTVVLAAGVMGHDCWLAGAAGCTYTFATVAGVTTITITAGSLQNIVEGKALDAGTFCLSWAGTAQGKLTTGAYGASGSTWSIAGGSDVTLEFSTGTVSKVQFERSTVPTVYEFGLPELEVIRCQRRFNRIGATGFIVANATYIASDTAVIFVQLPVAPRGTPTITYSGTLILIGGGTSLTLAGSASAISVAGNIVKFQLGAPSMAANVPHLLYISSGYIDFTS